MTMSTKFADNGSTVSVLTFDDDRVSENLAPAVYVVEFNPLTGFYLRKKHRAFHIPPKVYGSMHNKRDKVLSAYSNAERSMGVLLSGDKGAGKTMVASVIAQHTMKELELPVLLIEEALPQAPLIEFLAKIGECVLFIDEFGKKFDDEDGEQGALLGLFDGIDSHKKLVLLTENHIRHINEFMINRPGRVHYHFRFDKLPEDIVYEYCEDYAVPDDTRDKILTRRESSFEFSFDTLQAIVREYTLFGGDVDELMKDLNIESPLDLSREVFDVINIKDLTLGVDRELCESDKKTTLMFPSGHRTLHLDLKPLTGSVKKSASTLNQAMKGDDEDFGASFVLSSKNLVRRDGDTYIYAITDDEQHDLLVTAKKRKMTHSYLY